MRTILSTIRTQAKIPDLTPRMCRTTFSTLFGLAHTSDPRDLQDLMGHSTADLTMGIYRKPITTQHAAAVNELGARKVVTMPGKAEVA